MHDFGTNLPPVEISGSGTQKPPVHVCKSACSDAGTFAAGTQCALAQAPSHAGNVDGSTTGGPVHGQLEHRGGCAGMSHASVHAPVGAVGSAAVGLKQGAHFSPSSQVSFGSCAACAATDGKHADTQRPSAPATEVHVLGTKFPPVAMSLSGAHSPAAPPLAVHVSSRPCCAAGTLDAGRQCAPPHAGAQSSSDVGSMQRRPDVRAHAAAVVAADGAAVAGGAELLVDLARARRRLRSSGLMHGTHNSPSPQPSCPSSADCGFLDTSGMHFDKQTPAALPTDEVHAAGV